MNLPARRPPVPRSGSTAAAWDAQAPTYDAGRRDDPVHAACRRAATRSVAPGTGRCLDAGCGTGLSTVELAGRCAVVVAVDYSLESLKRLRDRGLSNVLLVRADLRALPFRDAAFEASVCANALQHLDPRGGRQRAAAELRRVTARLGVLSLSVHHHSRGKRRAGWIKEGELGQADVDYICRRRRSELKALLPGAAIRGVGFYGLAAVPVVGSRMQDALGRWLGRWAALLGRGHMLVARSINRTPLSRLRAAGRASRECSGAGD